jgi:hypothetical protein
LKSKSSGMSRPANVVTITPRSASVLSSRVTSAKALAHSP